jgi:hypothetical protein
MADLHFETLLADCLGQFGKKTWLTFRAEEPSSSMRHLLCIRTILQQVEQDGGLDVCLP